MCNHYSGPQMLFNYVERMRRIMKRRTHFSQIPEHLYPNFLAPIIAQVEGELELVEMRWGIWPFYDKVKPKKFVTNARSDRLKEISLWRQSTERRRCLIPAGGYFEPGLGPVGAKGEILFRVKDRETILIAGLWDTDPDESGTRAFTMVTTEPNDYVRPYHDRMPVVLNEDDAERWIGEEPLPDATLAELCKGLPSEALIHEEIAARPRKLTIKRPSKPVPPDDQMTLF